MCRRAWGWRYDKPLQLLADETGMSISTIRASISIFKKLQRASTPKRGSWVIQQHVERQPAVTEGDSNRKVFPSPKTPSISKDKVTKSTGVREGQESFFETPAWAVTINSTAEACGGDPLTTQQISKIEEKAPNLDLDDVAMQFDSHHRGVHGKKPYTRFATYLRFSNTWLGNALNPTERRNGASSSTGRKRTKPKPSNDDAKWKNYAVDVEAGNY